MGEPLDAIKRVWDSQAGTRDKAGAGAVEGLKYLIPGYSLYKAGDNIGGLADALGGKPALPDAKALGKPPPDPNLAQADVQAAMRAARARATGLYGRMGTFNSARGDAKLPTLGTPTLLGGG